jgi:NitT/TauT family transport system permease protein
MTDINLDKFTLDAADRIFAIAPAASEPAFTEAKSTLIGRLYAQEWLRRLTIVISLITLWQIYAMWLNNSLLVPTAGEVLLALIDGFRSGVLLGRITTSLGVLLLGYGTGLVIAAVLTALAMTSRLGRDFLTTLTAMFNPLPAIALLPLALLWLGLGTSSLVFVLVHSVVWSVSLSTLAGFDAVSPTLRMVGRNYGLRGPRYVLLILVPAAFPSLLTGLRVGWAFAWRTLIAAELVFGVSAGSGGLGWYIYENKNQLEIPAVFAGLAAVIAIGLAVEYLVFRVLEARTVRRWGMVG